MEMILDSDHATGFYPAPPVRSRHNVVDPTPGPIPTAIATPRRGAEARVIVEN